MKQFKKKLMGIIFACVGFPAFALDCSDALIKENITFNHERTVNLSLLKIVDEAMFNDKRTEILGAAKAIFKGVPVEGNFSYGKFDTARKSYFSKVKFEMNEEDATNYTISRLGKDSTKAFIECLSITASSSPWMSFYVNSADEDYVSVSVWWKPVEVNGSIPDANFKVLSVKGGKLLEEVGPKLVLGAETSLIFEREAGKPFRAFFSAFNSPAADLKIPLPPAIVLECSDRHLNDYISITRWTGSTQGACNDPGVCILNDTNKRVNGWSRVNVELACIDLISVTHNQYEPNFDGNWAPYPASRPLQKLEFTLPSGDEAEMLIRDSCASIKESGEKLDIAINTSGC